MTVLLPALAGAVAGLILGALHFALLARTAPLLLAERRGLFLAVQALRLALSVGALLWVGSAAGPWALLAAFATFLAARRIVTGAAREIAP